MPFQRIVVTLALLLGACCISAYPVYPGSNSAQGGPRQLMGVFSTSPGSRADGNTRQCVLFASAFGTVSHSILIGEMPKFRLDFNLAGGAVGFVADSKPLAGLQLSRNLNQALPAPEEGASHDEKAARRKGNKSTLQEDGPDRLVEDLDAVLWKMVAASELQSQGFTQTNQTPQQPSKRACFWKYCVTK